MFKLDIICLFLLSGCAALSNGDTLAGLLSDICAHYNCMVVNDTCDHESCNFPPPETDTPGEPKNNEGVTEYWPIDDSLYKSSDVNSAVKNVVIKRLPDESFIYNDQVYRADCRPYITDIKKKKGNTFPAFEACHNYYSVSNTSYRISLFQCQPGKIYVHPKGCERVDEIPLDCIKQSTPCAPSIDPKEVKLDGKIIYEYFGVQFNDICQPINYTALFEVGDKFHNIEYCDEYYTLHDDETATLTACPKGTVFNKLTKECELNLPCYEYYYKCKDYIESN